MSAPLTDLEEKKVLFYLGYSIFEDNGPAMRAINSLASQPLAGDFVRPLIEKLDKLREEIFQDRILSSAIATAAIQIRGHYHFSMQCRQGRQIVGQLGSFIKVSVASDVFSNGAAFDPATFTSADAAGLPADARYAVSR